MAFFHHQTLNSRTGRPEMLLEELRDLGIDDRLDLVAALMHGMAVPLTSPAAPQALAAAGMLEGADRLRLASALLRDAATDANPSTKTSQLSRDGRRLWPCLGGPGLVMQRESGYENWQTGFDWIPYRSDQRAEIFLASCSGLRGLGKAIGHDIHLVGTSSSPHQIVAGLSARRYAGVHADSGGYLDATLCEEQTGFDDWQIVPLDVDVQDCLLGGGPVSMGPHSIAVMVPKGMNIIDFQARVQALVARCRLSTWIDYGEGARYCLEAVGTEPQTLVRGTRDRDEIVMADEVVLLDAANDARRLARLVEDMCVAYWLDLE